MKELTVKELAEFIFTHTVISKIIIYNENEEDWVWEITSLESDCPVWDCLITFADSFSTVDEEPMMIWIDLPVEHLD